MPPLDTMMPCELLPSRSVDFSLILCGVVRDTTAREATAREAATREAKRHHREKGRRRHCKRCCSKNRSRERCHCEEHLSLWMLQFGSIRNDSCDSKSESYDTNTIQEQKRFIKRFVSWSCWIVSYRTIRIVNRTILTTMLYTIKIDDCKSPFGSRCYSIVPNVNKWILDHLRKSPPIPLLSSLVKQT